MAYSIAYPNIRGLFWIIHKKCRPLSFFKQQEHLFSLFNTPEFFALRANLPVLLVLFHFVEKRTKFHVRYNISL